VSTGAKRLLAVVVALVLVGAAFLVRSLIDDSGGDSAASSASGGGTPTLLCAAELERACHDLARQTGIHVQLEPADVTAEQLASLSSAELRGLGIDGWLTTSRDVEIARDKRTRASLDRGIGAPSAPIGRSPLVIGIWKDRAAALAASRCGGTISWRCIGDVAGRPWTEAGGQATWGVVKPAHATPASTREGLLVIGQAASSYFGRSNLSLDDYADDGFLAWFAQLEDHARLEAQSPFEQMLAGGAALYDLVGTTEAEAGPDLARAARDRRDQVQLLYPAPMATADIVYAPIEGAPGAGDLADIVTGDDGRAALARAGWRVDGEDRAPGVPATPPLPARDNLPDAGSLQALLQTWREVTG
jgi:hypothetical protein